MTEQEERNELAREFTERMTETVRATMMLTTNPLIARLIDWDRALAGSVEFFAEKLSLDELRASVAWQRSDAYKRQAELMPEFKVVLDAGITAALARLTEELKSV